MEFLDRHLRDKALNLLTKFPFLAITGPRQSGKTTFAKHLKPEFAYVNLELPDYRDFAKTDPMSFLKSYQNGVIIDEIQWVPELFSYLQVFSDERNKPGQYILTGSQNFLLSSQITQSLAGRVAMLNLLPFSLKELEPIKKFERWEELAVSGGYPRKYQFDIDPLDYYSNYIQTYLEREVRQILNVKDLMSFQKFIQLLAGRTGQLINQSSFSNELGLDNKTINSWLGVLEASFIAFRLPSYYQNFNKRILKTPKVYFYDTGVLCNLLGIKKEADLNLHFARGHIFENLVITEIMKNELNQGVKPSIYFWRDTHQNEVDLLQEKDGKLIAIEIKTSETFHPDFLKGLKNFQKIAPHAESKVIYAGSMIHQREMIQISNLWNI
ncbi:ATP-binding protein [Algoriphagus sp. A40]|uniref:ATP-binding protein n=1 Tax=Algoriphagus sp. A40 TaxID=1945863 RepID=UPI000985C439|nr:ATP-binding protein [Algoriphagus sp. A40]OOG77906.1 hypothetical protein B0E43_03865 [Algoriphagus sp. A40]